MKTVAVLPFRNAGSPDDEYLADALTGYVNHQIDVVTRRSEYRLRKAKERDHIVEGLIRALDVIDARVDVGHDWGEP